ncbi:hypothetical protein V5O55_22705 [Escherichia coli]|uniref:hypothetical protein n=1 Tax=Escherichia coli TaxID=562 RepID=UPI003FA23025
MATKTGFIAPPWPHVRGDSVSAASLISRIEKEAHRGCGLHYEIYQYRALCELHDVLTSLSVRDAETFMTVAADHGFSLSDNDFQERRKRYIETMEDIRRDQE